MDTKWRKYFRFRENGCPGRLLQPVLVDTFGEPEATPLDPGARRFSVDYRKSPRQMIAEGRYNRTNSELLPSSFSVEGQGVVEFESRYFWFEQKYLSEEARGVVEQAERTHPWMPAKLEHTLAYGAKYPDKQKKCPIVGLGSVIEIGGSLYVSYLTSLGEERCFYLFPFDGFWSEKCAVLGVRKLIV